jgi:hypothetical protein
MASAQDAVAAADDAAIKIEKRLRRYKRRLKDRTATIRALEAQQFSANYVIEAPDEEAEEQEDWSPVTIAESTAALPELLRKRRDCRTRPYRRAR